MEKKLVWKGKTLTFNPGYLEDLGVKVNIALQEGFFEIESGCHKGVYRIVSRTEDSDLNCRLFEPED